MRSSAGRETALGCLLGVMALLVMWLAVWRHPPGAGRDLFPPPDGPEYFAGAVQLQTAGEYSIGVAGQRLPPRYPPGFSVVMVPFLGIVDQPVDAAFAANAVIALVVLLVVFAALWWHGRRLAAGLAALLLATTPMFLVLARAPTSDLAGMLLAAVGLGLTVRYGLGSRLQFGAAAAFVICLATIVRLDSLLLLPALAAAWLAHGQRPPRRLALHAAWLLLAGLAGAVPVLAHRLVEFGDLRTSGYSVWVPDRAGFFEAFGVEHVAANVRNLGREMMQSEWRTTIASRYGHGSYFGPAIVVLVLLAVAFWLPRRRGRALALGVVCYAVAMCCYFYTDARLCAPLLPPCVALTAVWVCEVRRAAVRLVAAALVVCHVLGVPGSGSFADTLPYLIESPPQAAPRYELMRSLERQAPGLVLCAFSAPYAQALLGNAWTVAPANDDHEYRFHPEFFRYGDGERREQVVRHRAANEPVYLVADRDFAARCAALAMLGRWRALQTSGEAGIAVLER